MDPMKVTSPAVQGKDPAEAPVERLHSFHSRYFEAEAVGSSSKDYEHTAFGSPSGGPRRIASFLDRMCARLDRRL